MGLDLFESMIQTAQTDPTFIGINNLNFYVSDVQTFELGKTFDLIVSFNALQWVPDQRAIWRQIRSHLAPGEDTYFF